MSGGLAPSKTTVYCSNLPFNLTNNDLHKVFEKYGKVAKITVMKDRENRRSKGVAFVLFLDRQAAQDAISGLNAKELFGRTLKCSIAKDNGRAADFIKRKTYPDKSRCYECGADGHLSYECPSNALGVRDRPKKERKRKRGKPTQQEVEVIENHDEDDEDDDDDDDDISLDEAIRLSREQWERENQSRGQEDTESRRGDGKIAPPNARKVKRTGYFSDEEASD
ncbi:zinc finger CCHC-type and RNA-binding motif-containing protein 1-like [Oscarella lobularis]|uniref:zinc finger CCHC-type and RNA-binding motif-containing protein 1-like n=1 Tax=Oscarella lobularis TaxID=121494 RepID=UPI003313F88D